MSRALGASRPRSRAGVDVATPNALVTPDISPRPHVCVCEGCTRTPLWSSRFLRRSRTARVRPRSRAPQAMRGDQRSFPSRGQTTFSSPFPHHANAGGPVERYIGQSEFDQFRDTEGACETEVKHRAVTDSEAGGHIGSVENRSDLAHREMSDDGLSWRFSGIAWIWHACARADGTLSST
jgi:hypothetical protein